MTIWFVQHFESSKNNSKNRAAKNIARGAKIFTKGAKKITRGANLVLKLVTQHRLILEV